MSKSVNPLLSLSAFGRITAKLAARRSKSGYHIMSTPYPRDAKTSGQLAWRTMYHLAVSLWHSLSAAEKKTWESLATPHHMTGYAYFLSQALRPNPGIYLPLAGGTMTGNVLANPGVTFDGADLSELPFANYLPLAGGAMAGNIAMAGHQLTGELYRAQRAIFDYTVPSNAQAIDINTLDINAHGYYILQGSFYNPTAGDVALVLYVNTDYTETNYYAQVLDADGAVLTVARFNSCYLGGIPATNRLEVIAWIFRDPSGYSRHFTCTTRQTGAAVVIQNWACCKVATVTNITKLRIYAGAANSIGAGSRIMLSKPISD